VPDEFRPTMNVVVRLLLDAAADGDVVGHAETPDTGEQRSIRDAEELRAWLQYTAIRRRRAGQVRGAAPDPSADHSDR
jgi:hypothetical protein